MRPFTRLSQNRDIHRRWPQNRDILYRFCAQETQALAAEKQALAAEKQALEERDAALRAAEKRRDGGEAV